MIVKYVTLVFQAKFHLMYEIHTVHVITEYIKNRVFEPRYCKKGENCKEFCVIVSSHSLCPTTGKQFQDYVRAKSNYVVKLV